MKWKSQLLLITLLLSGHGLYAATRYRRGGPYKHSCSTERNICRINR
jgi:hypothetical protein